MDEKYQCIGRNIGEIHRASIMYFANEFSKFNIGAGQYVFLLNLYRNEGITQDELTSIVKLDKATTARALKKLEDEGYVKRVRREDDKRFYSIMLTEKAKEIKQDIYSIMNTWEEKMRNCFTDEESKELIRLLNKLNNSIYKK